MQSRVWFGADIVRPLGDRRALKAIFAQIRKRAEQLEITHIVRVERKVWCDGPNDYTAVNIFGATKQGMH